MKLISYLLLVSLPVLIISNGIEMSGNKKSEMENKQIDPVYIVSRREKPLKIDADWDKPQWKRIKSIRIEKYMGKIPKFKPTVEAKMMYDDQNVYVIFRVKDRFVRSVVQEYNGDVSGDSCVEFFFSPDSNAPYKYFNLEVNAGGTPLIFYIIQPFSDYKRLQPDEIKQIEIAHSLPEKIDPEITERITWTIEYRIPLSLLSKYSNVSRPAPGVTWKANFYKTGSQTSNPNYITWAFVDYPNPNFHLPEFFGTIKFQ